MDKNKKIFYITTNASWSGSEELWTRSAKEMIERGYIVSVSSPFKHPGIESLAAPKVSLLPYTFFFRKIFEKLKIVKTRERMFSLLKYFNSHKPDLIIISQGNNVDSLYVMLTCQQSEIPYITITQLVTEVFLLVINNDNLPQFQKAYLGALKNYFVSKKNLELNDLMLGLKLSNSEIINNPCKLLKDNVLSYPSTSGVYSIGLVGRIECFHKGFDLLVELASQQKWRERPIHFNIYGEGPHADLLNSNITRFKLKNITLRGYEKNVEKVWGQNHILFLPSRMEGQSLSLIEAMFCERAAIVTDVGGATELIDDGINGFVADSATVKSLDDALERAWNRRSTWKELGLKAAARLKEKYNEDAVKYFNKKVIGELSGKSKFSNSE